MASLTSYGIAKLSLQWTKVSSKSKTANFFFFKSFSKGNLINNLGVYNQYTLEEILNGGELQINI